MPSRRCQISKGGEIFVARNVSRLDDPVGQVDELVYSLYQLSTTEYAESRAPAVVRWRREAAPKFLEFTEEIAAEAWFHPEHLDVLVSGHLQPFRRRRPGRRARASGASSQSVARAAPLRRSAATPP